MFRSPPLKPGLYTTSKLLEPVFPLGVNGWPLTRQPKVLAPVWVAGGSWRAGSAGAGSFLHLLHWASSSKAKYSGSLGFIRGRYWGSRESQNAAHWSKKTVVMVRRKPFYMLQTVVAVAELHWGSFTFGQLLEQRPILLPDPAAEQVKACIRGWHGPR